jgi:hypothetical protein
MIRLSQSSSPLDSSSSPSFGITTSKTKFTEGKLVLLGIVAMIVTFAILLIFVSGGEVRHVPITWKEKVEATVAIHFLTSPACLVFQY